MGLKRFLKFVLPWTITLTVFVIFFSRIRFSEVLEVLKQTNVKLFFLSLLISLFPYTCFAIVKYREILKILGCRLSFFETLILRIGSAPLKAIIPFKMGELTKPAYLKKKHNLSYTRGISSVLWGYALSLFVLFFFIFIGWFLYYLEMSQRIYLALLFLFFLLLIVLLLRVEIISHFVKKFLKRLYPGEERSSKICWPKTIAILLFYSLGFECCKLLNALLLFNALNIEIPYSAFFLFTPLTILASTLPVTFGGLGVRESAILILFSDYAIPAKLLGVSLLIFSANRLLPILLGLFFMKPFLSRLLNINRTGRAY
ncbi:MAG: flippase-like domain-containing protein [Candidatus Omnitrophica bacterium]|nr:flippase-like domain-containing protein [Candidatus Omnitrophota bacterium]